MTDVELEFTGERFTPECVREIWYEHMHRYVAICEMVRGKSVLDIACGEGYGSHLLAGYASDVTGMDISSQAVEHATKKYHATNNLGFAQASVTDIKAADDSFDVIVSFETVEHLLEQEQMMTEFNRVLKGDGFIVISSPDKANYSDAVGHDNEFHVRELYRDEFESLVGRYFPAQVLFAQKLMFQSVIYNLSQRALTEPSGLSWNILDGDKICDPSKIAPLYYIAMAARDAQHLPSKKPDVLLFQDTDESVYKHYYHEIRKNMHSGQMLIEYQEKLTEMEAKFKKLDRLPRWIKRLLGI